MAQYEYVFTALKGRQGERGYYVAMCPLKLVPKLFTFSSQSLPPDLRSQRVLNKARIPQIAEYITKNSKNYIFSSLTVSIDREVEFECISNNGKTVEDVGKLKIPMDAGFLINDGQHRRAAIEKALEEKPEIGDETISVVFYIDVGLKKSQQMFADLNKHAVRPSRSLGILYDHRDPVSTLARIVMKKVEVFNKLTEKEKTSISNRSTKLFTLSSIYQGTMSLLNITKNESEITDHHEKISIDYWNEACKNMKDWQLAARKEVSCFELRRDYIHAHGLAVNSLGRLGAALLSEPNKDYRVELKKLNDIDWSRENSSLWEGRAMINGRISKSNNCIILTTNLLKRKIGLPLNHKEMEIESEFLKKV
jgi:DNA sulfur modification protein DndB